MSISILAHSAAGIAIFASGVWGIDRLDRDRRDHSTLALMAPPPASGGSTADLPEQKVNAKPPKVVAKVIVQPPPKQDDVKRDKSDTSDNTPGEGSGKGPPGIGDDDGTCTNPPCGIDKEAPPPKEEPKKDPPVVKKDVTVPPDVLTMMRTHGTTQIHPDDNTKNRMIHEGRTTSIAVVKVCVSEAGAIKQLSMLKSTGYPAYDTVLLNTIRGDWKYKAYQTGGQAVTACGTVTFQYRLSGH